MSPLCKLFIIFLNIFFMDLLTLELHIAYMYHEFVHFLGHTHFPPSTVPSVLVW